MSYNGAGGCEREGVLADRRASQPADGLAGERAGRTAERQVGGRTANTGIRCYMADVSNADNILYSPYYSDKYTIAYQGRQR